MFINRDGGIQSSIAKYFLDCVDYFGPLINMNLTLVIIVNYGEFWLIVVVNKQQWWW